jgi:ATP-dependent DNA helicase PIF1
VGRPFSLTVLSRTVTSIASAVAVTASTGIAATHIGGMTIHSWSGMGIRDTLSDDEIDDLVSREYLVKRFVKTSVLIIDEISMMGGNFLATLDRLLRSAMVSLEPFGGNSDCA